MYEVDPVFLNILILELIGASCNNFIALTSLDDKFSDFGHIPMQMPSQTSEASSIILSKPSPLVAVISKKLSSLLLTLVRSVADRLRPMMTVLGGLFSVTCDTPLFRTFSI